MSSRSSRRIDPLLITGLAIVAFVLLLGIIAPLITSHDPLAQNVRARLASPSGDHWLGTDLLGRDVFSRLLHGARIDIPLALVATLLPSVIGTVLGTVSGYYSRRLVTRDWCEPRWPD